MKSFGPPEKVYVENEWYDGPRLGVADVNGVPHRFKSLFDEEEDEYLSTYLVWPIEDQYLELEIEQWNIFVKWNSMYESGTVGADSHPGHGGIDKRYDEIQSYLMASRDTLPPTAKRAKAKFEHNDTVTRYSSSGPGYSLRWRLL
ncbi:hypothetical protein CWE13_03040 [Aliidiomarina shirensis]|uniref:Uncharacterized protein n=1 Tax=Aliidiomarina shirensis TaxID=1048642 RepID=A0A432WY07_9GAMM|nr:hypothetical protein [Aliidiomarina shirensis]RUO38636.1 hypothetical protein CWE13_03040 [Aliidiomarina shirensis]